MEKRLIAKDTYTVKVKKIGRLDFFIFCLAPIFIFNPEMAVIDIIPDFLGYILMLIPLMKLRDINERLDDARKHILIALLINIGKYVAMLLSFGALGSQEGGASSSLMMFSLVFAVFDIIFVTAAFRIFFEGMQQIGDKYESKAITGYKEWVRNGVKYRKAKNRTEQLSRLSSLFIIVRAVCFALPEFSTGSAHSYDDTSFDFSKFTGLFRIFGVMICLVFGVIWLVRAICYFARIFKEKDFILRVNEDYKTSAQGFKIKFIIRNIFTLSTFMTVSLALAPDIYIYNNRINILPDTLSAIAVFIMLVLSYSLFKQNKKTAMKIAIPAGVWIVTSAIKDALHFVYFNRFSMHDSQRNPDAYSLYTAFEAVSVVDAVAFLAVVFSFCSVINFINNEYAVSKLSLENESILRMKDIERAEYRKSYILPARIFAVISAILSALYPFLLTLTAIKVPDTADKYKSPEYFVANFAKGYWFFDFAAAVILAIVLIRALSALKDRSENNLMLE